MPPHLSFVVFSASSMPSSQTPASLCPLLCAPHHWTSARALSHYHPESDDASNGLAPHTEALLQCTEVKVRSDWGAVLRPATVFIGSRLLQVSPEGCRVLGRLLGRPTCRSQIHKPPQHRGLEHGGPDSSRDARNHIQPRSASSENAQMAYVRGTFRNGGDTWPRTSSMSMLSP